MIMRGIDYLGERLWGRDYYRRRYYKLAKKMAAAKGFDVYKPNLVWLSDPLYSGALGKVRERGIEGIPNDRCYMLLEIARSLRGIEGHFAECGVRYGKSSLFLMTGAGADSGKCLHVFDSFEGLSDPGPQDVKPGGDLEWSRGDLAVPEEIVRRNLSDFGDRVVLHKGWIPDRFPEVENERFSLVHVDVDLYEPTMAAIEFFYPRVNSGGVILCDDYGSADCPGAKRAIDAFFDDKPENVIGLTSGQSLVIKR